MTTIEGNKLIAEFDGWVQDVNVKDRPYWHPERNMTMYTYVDGFKYHLSWDWLMPVVEKINKIKGFDIIIYKTTVHVNDDTQIIFETTDRINIINAVWHAVVQFIQWYN